MTYSASYAPDDDKIRLRASSRLPTDLYERVKAAGFRWAPKQDLFFAYWTPAAEDLALELAGEIDDEDTSLVERAEDRADRFAGYQEKRADDAAAAHRAVSAIADNIPLGQPILVGHHSERRARKDAERITNGMRKAIKMWDTAQYWKDRAAGAIRHAKYVERPDVRHRRIKKLEADLRKQEKATKDADAFLALWRRDGLMLDQALAIANYDHVHVADGGSSYGVTLWSLLDTGKITAPAAAEKATGMHVRGNEIRARWVAHLNNRLTYERAMLGEAGGVISDRFAVVVGGQVLVSRFARAPAWCTVLKVNRAAGRINSVRASTVGVIGIEAVKDYRPPTPEQIEAARAATKLPPMTNFLPEGKTIATFQRERTADHGRQAQAVSAVSIAQTEWDQKHKDYKGSRVVAATETHGAYRCRMMVRGGDLVRVFIADAKVVGPPAKTSKPDPEIPAPEPIVRAARAPVPPRPAEADAFDAMRATLKAGVQAVSAPQLFTTPRRVVDRMLSLAEIESGHRVLEPSAGTGAIVDQLERYCGTTVVCVEINAAMADNLRARYPGVEVKHGDFLEQTALGLFDRILLNPPFADGADVKHILWARSMLKPGGRLVAICADGPRQEKALRPLADSWEDLPFRTFAGTWVRSVLLTMSATAQATEVRDGARPLNSSG